MNNPQAFEEKSMKQIIRRANTFGLHSFLIAAQTDDKQISVRYENMTLNASIKVGFMAIANAINYRLQNSTADSIEHRKAMQDFLDSISKAVYDLNKATHVE